MEQNTHQDDFRLRKRPQTRECIMLWLDEFGLEDADDEAVACLVKRLDTLAVPWDGDPEKIKAFIGDLIEWVSARVNGRAETVLRDASAMLSGAFVEAGLVEEPRCVVPAGPGDDTKMEPTDTGPESRTGDDAGPTADASDAQDEAGGEAVIRPMRRDLIYTSPVEVELADGSRGSVLHPPFDGTVKMKPERGRSRIVPLDDVTDGSLQDLWAVLIRRRVEVHVRCSLAACSQARRLWLTQDLRVEDIDGETECRVDDLFWGRCPKHTRKK